jgi:hypothetical protein
VNWEAIGAIGEVVGAAGVILTLGYLAVQIRQNSNVIRSSTRQAISTNQMEMGFRVAENADLRAAFSRWNRGEAPSSLDEELTGHLLRRSILRSLENQYHQHKDGTFDDATWSGYFESMKRGFETPTAIEFWEANRTLYSTEFADFVEREILSESNVENTG